MYEEDISMEVILKRISPWFGLGLALISIYFSYDGLDQSVTGGNADYTEIAKYIGWIMAIAVTLIQFIFNSDFARLNLTLKVVGVVSYGYSLYTNYLGLEHLFGFSGITGVAVAIFMDVTPEAIIAWSLEEETQGDMLGNIGKWITGGGKRRFRKGQGNSPKQDNRPANQYHADTRRQEPVTQPKMPSIPDKKGRDRRSFLEDQYQNKRNDKPSPEASKRGLYKSEKPNRFSGFGE